MTLEDHVRIQKGLVFRLQNTGYTRIYQNFEYQVKLNGKVYCGEVDFLALSPRGKLHFYEIKSCSQKVNYARDQYERFKRSHPFSFIRGIYVSPKKVCLL